MGSDGSAQIGIWLYDFHIFVQKFPSNKMDASNFTVQLDLVASGLIRTIEDQLLQGEMEKMRIRAELYTLNVYGNRCS